MCIRDRGIIINTVIKNLGVNIICALNARYTDSMRTDAVNRLQMLSMHQQGSELIFVELQAKQNAQADIIDAAFHSPVHGLRMISIVMLRSGWVQLFIALFTVSYTHLDVYKRQTLDGAKELNAYSDEYETLTENWLDANEQFGETRAQLRSDSIRGEAEQELADAQQPVSYTHLHPRALVP